MITSHEKGVSTGDDCLIGPNISIIGNNYRHDRLDVPIRLQEKISVKGIRVGNDVWIGAGCVLLDGAEIGSGSILAPNSVVSGKVVFTRR